MYTGAFIHNSNICVLTAQARNAETATNVATSGVDGKEKREMLTQECH